MPRQSKGVHEPCQSLPLLDTALQIFLLQLFLPHNELFASPNEWTAAAAKTEAHRAGSTAADEQNSDMI